MYVISMHHRTKQVQAGRQTDKQTNKRDEESIRKTISGESLPIIGFPALENLTEFQQIHHYECVDSSLNLDRSSRVSAKRSGSGCFVSRFCPVRLGTCEAVEKGDVVCDEKEKKGEDGTSAC